MGVSFGLVIFNKNNKIIDFTSGFKISIYLCCGELGLLLPTPLVVVLKALRGLVLDALVLLVAVFVEELRALDLALQPP